MSFDPSPIEWFALTAFTVMGGLLGVFFVGAAMAFGWRLWWHGIHRRDRPPTQPQLFCIAYGLVQAAGGIGVWLMWRAAHRGLDHITNGMLMAFMVVHLINWFTQIWMGPALFCTGMQLGYMSVGTIVAVLSSLMWIALVAIAFASGVNAAGGVLLAPAVWSVYMVVLAVMLHMLMSRHNHGVAVLHSPIEQLDAQVRRLSALVEGADALGEGTGAGGYHHSRHHQERHGGHHRHGSAPPRGGAPMRQMSSMRQSNR